MYRKSPQFGERVFRTQCEESARRSTLTLALIASICLLASACMAGSASAAQPPVGLGTSGSFAVLGGSAVTNTGPSTINGELGVYPGTSITGFPPGTVNAAVHATDAVAGQAQADLTTAYNDAAGRTPPLAVPPDLGGLTVTPGVFRNASAMQLTGALTLNAQGDPNAVFIFQAGSSLTTASDSRVNLMNGAQACNVFWQVGSSATLGTTTQFVGNILALTSISLNDAVTVNGRLMARNGAVTLINDTVNAANCAAGTVGGGPGGPGSGGGSNGGSSSHKGTALMTTTPRYIGQLITRWGTERCIDRSFRVVVNGLKIRSVEFRMGRRTIGVDKRAPFSTVVNVHRGGIQTVTAIVTFSDGTKSARLRMKYKSCGEAVSAAPQLPVGFTG